MEVSILDTNYKQQKLNRIINMIDPHEIRERQTSERVAQHSNKKEV